MNENIEKAKELLHRAETLFSTADYQSSFSIYEEVVNLFEEESDWENYVNARSKIGRYYIKVTQYDDAIYYINETLEIALLELESTHELIGYSYDHLGTCYYYKAVYHTAIEFYNKGYEIRLINFGEHHEMIGRSYNNIGNCYLALDNIELALSYYHKALHIRKVILAENNPSFAYTYAAIGACLVHQGDLEESLQYYKRALSIRKDNYGEEHPMTAYSFSDIAGAYHAKKEYQKALHLATKALKIRLGVFGEKQHTTAASYVQLGEIQSSMGLEKEALGNLEKALEIRMQLYGRIHPEIANSHQVIGNYYVKQADYLNSNKHFKKEAVILTQIHGTKHQNLAENNINIAKVHKQKGEFKRALLNCQKALTNLLHDFNNMDIYHNPKAKRRSSYLTFLTALSMKAELLDGYYQANGNPDDIWFAQFTWTQCLEVVDQIRNSYLTEHAKLNLSGKVVSIYENALINILNCYELSPKDNLLEQAFAIAEKGRASALFSHLKDVEARSSVEIPEEIREQEIKLRTELTQIDLNISLEKNKKDQINPSIIEALENQHFDINQVYEQLIKKFEIDYPSYFDLKYNTKTITVKELQNQLTIQKDFKHTTILEYIIVKNTLYIFIISKELYKIIPVALPDNFNEIIQEYNNAISFVEFDDFYNWASQLYNYLINPIEKELKFTNKLIIIRDAILGFTSFDALVNPGEKANSYQECNYLIQGFEIAYHYSVSLMMNSIQRKKITEKEADTFVGLAPVDFSEGNPREMSKESGRGMTKVMRKVGLDGELHNLPKTAEEVEKVYQIFEKKKLPAKVFVYGAATKNNLINNSLKHKYILISTHGFSSEEENLSGIFLSNKKGRDILYTPEVYNLKLNSDLVVLSSCSSGIGKLYKGEGMIALNRGFLFAGASNVIFTQFDIPDAASSILVEKLFQFILEGNSYSLALKKAKLYFITNENYSPQDWTGFALIGC